MITIKPGGYVVTVRDDDGRERECYICHTHEEMERRIGVLRSKHSGIRWVDPQPQAVAGRRRRIDWTEIGLVIAGVLIAIVSVVAFLFANPIAWDALVKLASHPFIVDNAAGLAVTAAGLAIIRHLRPHPGR